MVKVQSLLLLRWGTNKDILLMFFQINGCAPVGLWTPVKEHREVTLMPEILEPSGAAALGQATKLL